MWNFQKLYTSISKNCGECEMQLVNTKFNNIQSEWFNSCVNVNHSKDAKKKKLTHSNINVRYWIVMCVSIYISKCNVQHLNNDFDKFKVVNSSHG